jgi:hypothetical protein
MSALPSAAVRLEQPTYVFQGRQVTLPVYVRKASTVGATYLVSSSAARRLVTDPRLEIAEVLPGRTLFSLSCIDYQDNDLGDYDEVSLAFFVRERPTVASVPYVGTAFDFVRNRLATYIYRLPVNQSFTCEAGRGIWGFPKTVEQIEIDTSDGRTQCSLHSGGLHVLTFSAPCGGTRTLPEVEMVTYSHIDGVLHKTVFASGAADVGFSFGGAKLELGDHPIAAELRSLGLPKRALLSMWMGRMYGRFDAPVPV